jgi:hypothetical protein
MRGIAIANGALQYEDAAETLEVFAVALFGGTPYEKAAQDAVGQPSSRHPA